MDLLEHLLYPLYQTAILAAAGLVLLCRRRYRSATALLVLGACWLWLCATPAMAMRLREALERHYPPRDAATYAKSDAIVILGGGALLPSGSDRDADDADSLATRIGFGLQLFRDSRADVVLLSGSDQAQRMTQRLLQEGVPASALQTEWASTNTHENAVFSAAMLKRAKRLHILLVTSGFHMARAAAAFAKQGLDVVPAPAYDPDYPYWQAHPWWPRRSALHVSGHCLREFGALWWYRLRGWA
ncbi:YdcF family protein [Dyella acidiphila]|uniref:YdcF family protein n=1 Tax=Dyella acidiphila TaxID=2775866 RepID=A0ABR9GDA4_9GAMM|nr:YdcF family protein [Dyella acidiphila]MBE1161979.1 YdcF family protein [Dyella acidiphila]